MALNQLVLASNWSLTGGGALTVAASSSDVQVCSTLASAKSLRFVQELHGQGLKNGAGVGGSSRRSSTSVAARTRRRSRRSRRRFSDDGDDDELAPLRISCVSTSEVSTASDSGSDSKLPLKAIPGEYGGTLGAIKDRLDFFWFQGLGEFFTSRMKKYQSTVFRVNMPPGPPGFPDPRVILLLDAKSYPVLFDVNKVLKKDVFTGTYHPSWDYTGGVRVLAYLDPSEERHTKLKTFVFEILKTNGRKFLPEFHKAISESFQVWESNLAKGEKASFTDENLQFAFNFQMRAIVGRDPVAPGPASLGRNGGAYAQKWVAPQIAPVTGLGLPHLLEELTFHSFPLPFSLVKKEYDALYAYLSTYATEVVEIATKLGIDKHDAINNVLFFTCFNSFGGFGILLPQILRAIAQEGSSLQQELVREVRAAVNANGGSVTMKGLESMELVKSVVWESLRINPPVPYQYGIAKSDFVIESHKAAFQVKKGEMLAGFQPFATQDPVIFQDPQTFLPKRFVGPEAEKLLPYVIWSNGPETGEPTVGNKTCPGKDFVVAMSRAFVAELFLRYDEFTLAPPDGDGIAAKIAFSSLKKAQ